MNWFDPSYLQHGNERQRAAFQVLEHLNIFNVLDEYSPVLVGTIPIDLDLPGSDLDIICHVADIAPFRAIVHKAYARYENFQEKSREHYGEFSYIVNFDTPQFPIEIFAQNRPVRYQNAYRHMLIEDRLLRLGGDGIREDIRKLKAKGLKTEPAFARYLGLNQGDPYIRLLELETWDDKQLLVLINERLSSQD